MSLSPKSIKSRTKAIIFDCDGTLVDSEPAHKIDFTDALHLKRPNSDSILLNQVTWKER